MLNNIIFNLIDNERFGVEIDNTNQELRKLMHSGDYDSILNCWKFNLGHYESLINSLKPKFESFITELCITVVQVFENKIKNRESVIIDMNYVRTKIASKLSQILKEFQLESIAFAIKNEGKIILADDMGLGKTFQALALISYYYSELPCLIIVPSSIKIMWEEYILEYLDLKVQIIENGKSKLDKECNCFIISYDLVKTKLPELLEMDFKIIICDESHSLKNITAKKTIAIMTLVEKAKRIIFISGTPALSRPCELYTQLKMISPEIFCSHFEFAKRYCDSKLVNGYWDYKGSSNSNELKILLQERFLIRHEKIDQFDPDIKKIREKIILNQNLIDLNDRKFLIERLKFEQTNTSINTNSIMDYYTESSRLKEKAVCEHVKKLLSKGQKLIVFAYHQNMIIQLENMLIENQHDFIRIDGKTANKNRHKLVKRFQDSDKCVCGLLSITAAGVGITLTKSNFVVFAELYWNPSHMSIFFCKYFFL